MVFVYCGHAKRHLRCSGSNKGVKFSTFAFSFSFPIVREAIITIQKLGKKYSLRHQENGCYTALRDVLTYKAKSLFHCDALTADEFQNSDLLKIKIFSCTQWRQMEPLI